MDKAEASERYKNAIDLYQREEYDEALAEFAALSERYPRNPRVLEGKARSLEHLGHLQEALNIYERLLDEFDYEDARPRRDRVAALLGVDRKRDDAILGEVVVDDDDREDTVGATPKRRLRIKPVRLLVLIGLVAGMYFGYVPYWLGGGVIAAYFIIKLVLKRAFVYLFTIPFRMKGRALAGATAQVHGFQWTTAPALTDGDDEDAPKGPMRHVWIDVTISPPARTQGFTHWEPGELALAPKSVRYRGLDDMDKCFQVKEVRYVGEGDEEVDDEGMKVAGTHRIKVLAAVPLDQDAFRFVYYFETFGDVSLRQGAVA